MNSNEVMRFWLRIGLMGHCKASSSGPIGL